MPVTPATLTPGPRVGRVVNMVSSLPHPTTPAGRDGLAALLARPEKAVVALDFDGTPA